MTTEEKRVNDAILKPEVQSLTNVSNQQYQIVNCQSRIAKLWTQYVEQIVLMQQFVRAERSGNFALHLHAIAQAQPASILQGDYIIVRNVISSISANYGRSGLRDAI